MSQSRLSLTGMRMAYFTPRLSNASRISGLAEASSAQNTTTLPSFYCHSISGNSRRRIAEEARLSTSLAAPESLGMRMMNETAPTEAVWMYDWWRSGVENENHG